jgi:hypothetical protein
MGKTNNYIRTVLNPAGFIEQHYVGSQAPQEVHKAIRDLKRFAKKLEESNKAVLILVDVSRVTKIDLGPRMLRARVAGMKTMRALNYKRAAVYGPLPIQVLVNTLALVAGVHDKIRVFDTRLDAVRWLRSKK